MAGKAKRVTPFHLYPDSRGSLQRSGGSVKVFTNRIRVDLGLLPGLDVQRQGINSHPASTQMMARQVPESPPHCLLLSDLTRPAWQPFMNSAKQAEQTSQFPVNGGGDSFTK